MIKDLARKDVVTVEPDSTVKEVADNMRRETVGSVIVEGSGHPAGIITDRDLTVRILATDKDPKSLDASDLMTEDPITIEETAGLYELCDLMSKDAVRRMPTVNEDGKLTGIITLDDLIVLLTDELEKLSGIIEFESPQY